jgi:8-amino-7-oxononanoate synthase
MYQMLQIPQIPDRQLTLGGKEYLWFGGTSYLGVAHQPSFRRLIQEGQQYVGYGWGSSRQNMLQLEVFEQFEAFLAHFSSATAAVTFSSGMLAGQCIQHFLPEAHKIYCPGLHPALWPVGFAPKKENYNVFTQALPQLVSQLPPGPVQLFTDSVSVPHVETYNFDWLAALPQNRDITLVVDDSHGIGLLGPSGGGFYKTIGHLANLNVIVLASLNKALGLPGGVILGTAATISAIKNTSFFASCSPILPAYAYAGAKAAAIYAQQLANLKVVNNYFLSESTGLPIKKGQKDYPVYEILEKDITEKLFKRAIVLPSFAYPGPNDTPVARLVISALHTKFDIDYLIKQLWTLRN